MLAKRFYEVWVLGAPGEREVEEIKKCLFEAVRVGEARLRLRIYTNKVEDISYLGELRRLLLENTSLSIVVESRNIGELPRDLEAHEGEVIFIANEPTPLFDLDSFREKLRVIKVGGGKEDEARHNPDD